MGEVYRARDEKLNRDVAIKVLPATLSQNADRLRRFEQEAQAAGALNHPNILAVYDVGMHDGAPYVVSECSAADAEDVLQTVFLRLVKGQESYDLSGHPEAYLSRAAINASLDWRHSDGHRRRSHNHHPPNKCGITLSGPRRQRTPSIRIGSRYPKNHLSFRLWTLKVR